MRSRTGPMVFMKITQNVATGAVAPFLTRWLEKRREDACALRKSRDCRTRQGGARYPSRTKCFQRSQPLRRSRLGVRCVFATVFVLVLISSRTFAQTPTPTATATPSPTATPTASPSATECPRPTPGTCVSYEAEDNTLTGSAFVLSCPTCSNGLKVGFVGNNSGTLQFDAVGAVAPGRYTVTIDYTNGDPVRYALLSVNGGQGMPLSF